MSKHICFISTNSTYWDASSSVYNEFCKDSNYSVDILSNNINFFSSQNISAINIGDIALSNYQPDIIFVDEPHLNYLPSIIVNMITNDAHALVCHVPYTMQVSASDALGFRLPIYDYCWKVFIDSNLKLDIYKKNYGEAIASEKFVVSGNPKLDQHFRSNIKIQDHHISALSGDNVKVLLAVHWNISHFYYDRPSLGYSTFMQYKDYYLNLFNNYSDIKFIFRPHPFLFQFVVGMGYMSANELSDYLACLESKENVFLSTEGTYYDLFKSCDAMITDCCSFLVEYLPTGKPLLHLSRDDSPGYNRQVEKIIESYYKATNQEEIESFMKKVVIQRDDYMAGSRDIALKENVFMPDEGSGRFIKDYIDEQLKERH